MNVRHCNETFVTDTIYADFPAIDKVLCCQVIFLHRIPFLRCTWCADRRWICSSSDG